MSDPLRSDGWIACPLRLVNEMAAACDSRFRCCGSRLLQLDLIFYQSYYVSDDHFISLKRDISFIVSGEELSSSVLRHQFCCLKRDISIISLERGVGYISFERDVESSMRHQVHHGGDISQR
ncbi:hypothetical protein F2Q70_00016290 [Brassica cretica]|uniref:Uncharacterized protein n=1 Tax=Brassica cretica TaxID=69181 RepID=A0A8S9HQ04_BRACR|nr:hypothetical protein F2Q70_00016290 [Brassica cretica]